MSTIATTLQRKYSLSDWQDVYDYLFPGCKLLKSPASIPEDSKLIDRMSQVGEATLEGGKLLFFDIVVNDKVVLERNRVALNNALAKRLVVGKYDAAIGVFHSSTSDSYRFTFVRKSVHFNDEGEIVNERTNARRYTYILGPGRHCRTAQQRFERLHGLPKATLADVEEAFSVEALTKQFYHELFDWYQWAASDEVGVFFPNLEDADDPKQALQEHLIRLITRLIFVWFIKQKGLVPDGLFKADEVARHLKDFSPDSATQNNYYRCYLQNLFFATLNREISERAFAKVWPAAQSDHGVSALYRYADEFSCVEAEIKALFSRIPYLNGGLFECLDRKDEASNTPAIYVDGFSRKKSVAAKLPNCLFFDAEKGIFPLLERYNFTVEENSALDQTVALDPELLGKVFENLLGAYNPETQQTARNDSGSFYTPREIVDYMVDESLLAYLKTNSAYEPSLLEELIRGEELQGALTTDAKARQELADLLFKVRILDPACGSGAFPVGALNRIIGILRKLSMGELDDYKAKMHLIEKCLYGVDIQNIAVQISKLRFFISLICEQTPDLNAPERNFGIAPLPNLETRFVAANTLINLQKDTSIELDMGDELLKQYQDERYEISQHLICPPNRREKKRLQAREKELARLTCKRLVQISCHPDQSRIDEWEKTIAELQTQRLAVAKPDYRQMAPKPEQLTFFDDEKPQQQNLTYDANEARRNVIDRSIKDLKKKIAIETAKDSNVDEKMRIAQKLSSWISSDLNATADFFDPEWMFAIKGGFDIVIGNPPYIQLQGDGGKLANLYQNEGFKTFERTGDIYCLFYERGWQLLKDNGHLCFITSNKWMRAGYGASMRSFLATRTNPELLIDFAGQKIFESATVDTNILLFAKAGENKGSTISYIARPDCRNDLSGFVRQNATECAFATSDSWVILTPIEQSIKRKIEAVGTPLKDWDIQINYGIKTGCNEAFIIDEAKRAELIAADPKSAEIIRPILRGRDIKRYGYNFAGLYLIAAHNGVPEKDIPRVNIDDYPAVKRHLDQYWDKISTRSDKGDTPYNLRSCAYMEDFFKQKIIYPNMTKYLPFFWDKEKFVTNQKCFIITGKHLGYLTAFLNSSLFKYCYRDSFPELQAGTRELSKIFFDKLAVAEVTDEQDAEFIALVEKNQTLPLKEERRKLEEYIDKLIFEIHGLTEEEAIQVGFIEIV